MDMTAASQPRPTDSHGFSEEEWQVRLDLAACYRLVARYGMTDVIYNHITARVPGPDHHILINPFGLMYEEITASNLYKVDLGGEIIWKPDDLPYGVNYPGYVIHSAIHAARPDVRCVLHTHTRAGMAVSAMKEGLLPVTQTALQFYGQIGYHDFEGPVVSLDEQGRLAANLGDRNAMILKNHGLLVCGPSVGQTFMLIHRLESACRAQVDLMAAGADINYPSTASMEQSAAIFNRPSSFVKMTNEPGSLEWSALLRQLDREAISYQS